MAGIHKLLYIEQEERYCQISSFILCNSVLKCCQAFTNDPQKKKKNIFLLNDYYFFKNQISYFFIIIIHCDRKFSWDLYIYTQF